ncbi:MAG: CopD family protein [Flavobacteriales bacterium]
MLYLKAAHIVFVVSWFAGLFYIVRLFIYHTEAQQREEGERKILQQQYKLMEKRLWFMIAWPSMILTLITGSWLALPYLMELTNYPWLMLKSGLVTGLVFYHFICGNMFKLLQNDIFRFSEFKLRLWNEVATLFLVSITFVIVLKDLLNWLWGLLGLVLLGILLMLAVRWYRKMRESKQGKGNN